MKKLNGNVSFQYAWTIPQQVDDNLAHDNLAGIFASLTEL